MSTLMLHMDKSVTDCELFTEGLDVTYEFTDEKLDFADENFDKETRFAGPRADLEKVVWRYVTPLEEIAKGRWVTAENARQDDREDFEWFALITD